MNKFSLKEFETIKYIKKLMHCQLHELSAYSLFSNQLSNNDFKLLVFAYISRNTNLQIHLLLLLLRNKWQYDKTKISTAALSCMYHRPLLHNWLQAWAQSTRGIWHATIDITHLFHVPKLFIHCTQFTLKHSFQYEIISVSAERIRVHTLTAVADFLHNHKQNPKWHCKKLTLKATR